jgi:hypothetical protein
MDVIGPVRRESVTDTTVKLAVARGVVLLGAVAAICMLFAVLLSVTPLMVTSEV